MSNTSKAPSGPNDLESAPQAGGAESNPQIRGTRPGCVDSTDLLRGQKTVEISHNGLTYRLQATRLGKLILTK